MKPYAETLFEYYETDLETGCWEWFGTKNKAGYGVISRLVDGKRHDRLAHRVSYEHHAGPIPAGMSVCHRCDKPGCVNPEHLFLGTHADNMADMQAKGRQNYGVGRRPTTYPKAKLAAIACDDRDPKVVAKEYGVTLSTVYRWRAKYRITI